MLGKLLNKYLLDSFRSTVPAMPGGCREEKILFLCYRKLVVKLVTFPRAWDVPGRELKLDFIPGKDFTTSTGR